MTITTFRHEELRAGVFKIEGDIDIASVPELREALDAMIESGFVNIVLDLTGVRYADSTALGLLVWLDRRLQEVDGKMVLSGAGRDIRRILEISRLPAVAGTLSETGSVAEALESIEPVAGSSAEEWVEELDMPADVGALAGVREHVCAMLDTLAFSDAAMFDIKVALGEALANAVRHGSPSGGGVVHIGLHVYPEKVSIEVKDSGAGFDGDHVCSDDLYASGGRGIMFMRALMDQVRFECSTEGGTIVTLVKHRTPAEA